MIQISEATANAVVKLLSDVEAVDSYAHCSDKFFRTHFQSVLLGHNASAARKEIEAALKAAEPRAEPEATDVKASVPIPKETEKTKKAKSTR